MMRTFLAILVFVCTFGVQNAMAEQPAQELIWNELAVVRANPLGLNFDGTLEYRLRLYESDSDALATNYISIAGKPIITPAFTRLGLRAEVMPLSLLRLGVQYEFIQYFGNFDFVQSYDDANAEWTADVIEAGGDADENYSANGTALTFIGLLQMAVGPIAVRTKTQLTQNSYNLNEGDTVYYDPYIDTILPRNGWYLQNEADALYLGDKLIAGLRHTFILPYNPGFESTAEDPNGPVHRVGPLIVYQFWSREEGALNSLRALGLFQWYLKHRFRAGQDTSQAIPYMGIGLVLEGKLL